LRQYTKQSIWYIRRVFYCAVHICLATKTICVIGIIGYNVGGFRKLLAKCNYRVATKRRPDNFENIICCICGERCFQNKNGASVVGWSCDFAADGLVFLLVE
jgi:hypothetical protein